ncbi:hypothetical protein X534_gp18 [Ralstonia phage RSB3]|uniref:Uncharacterized protein n=1 Tax=Ralstonia phage RSB3 TaxID=1402875 RepID=U3TM23_9CAUD|nr:hypothetical protein X534_gp18 [Ralstonia phage RSB3]BAN92329.1 hypothetical protein [Ralstonia phage RSB3]
MSILTAQNKAESYKTVPNVAEKVTSALREWSYCTRRQLHNITGIEIATLCGALKRLEKQGKVSTPFSIECESTGKMVAVYRLNLAELGE